MLCACLYMHVMEHVCHEVRGSLGYQAWWQEPLLVNFFVGVFCLDGGMCATCVAGTQTLELLDPLKLRDHLGTGN